MQAAALPCRAEFVGRHGDRAERGRGLALEEAEALRQLGRDQVAQADVVGEHHEADPFERGLGRHAHRDVAGDDGDLGLEVDAERFVGADDVVTRADQVVAAALVHQRIGVEARGHFGVARAPDQLDMVDERRAVGPLDARGSGAMQRAGSNANAWRVRPWFNACDSSSSCGA